MIHIERLDFSYGKRRLLFDQLSFGLQAGGITGLLGKNGAGKTTLLKIITGLLSPGSGAIEVQDHIPKRRQPSFLSQLYFVPEEFYLPPVSPSRFIRTNSVFYPSFDAGIMAKLVNEFEIPEEQSLEQQSYGQKKKFLISFALATRCKLLVLDEPTNGLDIPSKAIFRKVMAGTLDEDQLVLISTHQVKDVENLIDNVVILDNGKVILQKDLHTIASQLSFENSSVLDPETTLYGEPSPGGFRIIKRQVNGNTSVDIELLFNAITKGSKLFIHE